MSKWPIYALLLFSVVKCTTESTESETKAKEQRQTAIKEILDSTVVNSDSILVEAEQKESVIECAWDEYLQNQGLVNVQTIIPDIYVDLKYTTEDNFMERDMYGCLTNCYLQPDVAERLKKCQATLAEIDSSLTLLIYDGLRPRMVQQYMWDLLDMPINEKVKFVSNPAKGSLHNFGAAVDITLTQKNTGDALDMGTPYDYIGVKAWPTKEPQMLKDSILTQQQIDNRILLRKVMKAGNFFNIQTEWWHFNACYRNKAKELYKIVEGDSNLINV